LIDRYYKDVRQTRDMDQFKTFYSIEKARDLLGFAPQHSWRESRDLLEK